nr:hypothetical protein CFP56_09112 [Quercus suber]
MPPIIPHDDDNPFPRSDEGLLPIPATPPASDPTQHGTPPESEQDVLSKVRKTKKGKKGKKLQRSPKPDQLTPQNIWSGEEIVPDELLVPTHDETGNKFDSDDGPSLAVDETVPEAEVHIDPDPAQDELVPLGDSGEEPVITGRQETQPSVLIQGLDVIDRDDLPAKAMVQHSPALKAISLSTPTSPPKRPAVPVAPARRFNSPVEHRWTPQYDPAMQLPRESVPQQQQTSPRPSLMSPPLPYMPQEHFFRLPDLGLDLGQQKEIGRPAGSDGCCCCFDTFADAGDSLSGRKAKDALLVGFDGGIDVYRVLSDKLEVVGRLEGLRGSVIGAKVLPSLQKDDTLAHHRPAIALIVHGVMEDDRADPSQDVDTIRVSAYRYQTTVEVYALQSQQHIATLYKSLPLRTDGPVHGHSTTPPPSIGDLTIDAASTFVTVSSGKSGEIYIFSSARYDGLADPYFRMVGKFWTTLQVKQDSGAKELTPAVSTTANSPGVPLMSLSHRWLVFVPPYTSASHTVSGSPLLSTHNPTPPGLSSLSAPVQPNVSCEVAGVDAEGMLSWLSRTAAQGLVKASQKGYEISLQSWKELTNPSQSTSKTQVSTTEPSLFPPTNAPADDPRRLAKEPALVALIDLQKLLHYETYKPKQVLTPFATFALVDGCNHLSFSPDGLRLLTTNRKGEASTIWDLQNIVYSSTKTATSEDMNMERGPHIKQIHKIARSSPSLVIDSVWTKDGDWLALVTTHGTVHLHQIPASGASTKRRRRNTITASAPDKAEATVSVSQGMSPPSNGLWGKFSSGLQSVGVQVNAMRTQGSIQTTFAGFREATGTLKTAGGRAIAKGFNQGISAAKDGASDIWHAEDNKIRHKALQDRTTRAGCVRWMQRSSDASLAVACGGSVHIHGVSPVIRRKGEVDIPGLKQDKRGRKTFTLPRIGTGREGNATKQSQGCAGTGPHGFWSLRDSSPPDERFSGKQQAVVPPILPLPSQTTEVETNPPYCPFHIDSRISIFTYEEGSADAAARLDTFLLQGHTLDLVGEEFDPWLFGEPLPLSVKINDTPSSDLDGLDSARFEGNDDDGSDDDSLADQVESKLTIHNVGIEGNASQEIRVATRRTRRGGGGGGGEPGAGGFEMLEDDHDDDSETGMVWK